MHFDDDFPDPLALVNVSWDKFFDPKERDRRKAEAEVEWERFRKYGSPEDPLYIVLFGGQPSARGPAAEPAPSNAVDGQPAERHGHPPEPHYFDPDGERPEPPPGLMTYLNERVRAAAALVPATVINDRVRQVLKEWFRWRIEENRYGVFSEHAYFLGRVPDRDKRLGTLVDDYPASETPEIRFWLFVFARQRGTKHVQEFPELGTAPTTFYGDPAAVIWWPAEALREVLIELAVEAHEWPGTTGSVPPPPPVRRGNGGRSKSQPGFDKKVREAAQSGKFSELKVMAKVIGEDVEDVRRSSDRQRKNGLKWIKPAPS